MSEIWKWSHGKFAKTVTIFHCEWKLSSTLCIFPRDRAEDFFFLASGWYPRYLLFDALARTAKKAALLRATSSLPLRILRCFAFILARRNLSRPLSHLRKCVSLFRHGRGGNLAHGPRQSLATPLSPRVHAHLRRQLTRASSLRNFMNALALKSQNGYSLGWKSRCRC